MCGDSIEKADLIKIYAKENLLLNKIKSVEQFNAEYLVEITASEVLFCYLSRLDELENATKESKSASLKQDVKKKVEEVKGSYANMLYQIVKEEEERRDKEWEEGKLEGEKKEGELKEFIDLKRKERESSQEKIEKLKEGIFEDKQELEVVKGDREKDQEKYREAIKEIKLKQSNIQDQLKDLKDKLGNSVRPRMFWEHR